MLKNTSLKGKNKVKAVDIKRTYKMRLKHGLPVGKIEKLIKQHEIQKVIIRLINEEQDISPYNDEILSVKISAFFKEKISKEKVMYCRKLLKIPIATNTGGTKEISRKQIYFLKGRVKWKVSLKHVIKRTTK